MRDTINEQRIIDFLKSVATCTRCFEFASEERLASLPPDVSAHIEELEGLISRLSAEAESHLWRAGHGHTLYPNLKGGKR